MRGTVDNVTSVVLPLNSTWTSVVGTDDDDDDDDDAGATSGSFCRREVMSRERSILVDNVTVLTCWRLVAVYRVAGNLLWLVGLSNVDRRVSNSR